MREDADGTINNRKWYMEMIVTPRKRAEQVKTRFNELETSIILGMPISTLRWRRYHTKLGPKWIKGRSGRIYYVDLDKYVRERIN